MQPVAAIEFIVLTSVDHIETADPERNRRREQQDAWIERSANRNPRGRRRDSQRESQEQVREPRKTLRIGIEKHNCQRHRRQDERQAVELRCGQNECRAGENYECAHKAGREQPGRQGANAGAWIGRIDLRVSEPVERHRRGACRNHGDDDPQQLAPVRQPSGGEHRTAKGKWQRKDRVLPLDHVERELQILQLPHGNIVNGHVAWVQSRMSASWLTIVSRCLLLAACHSAFDARPSSAYLSGERHLLLWRRTGLPVKSDVTPTICSPPSAPTSISCTSGGSDARSKNNLSGGHGSRLYCGRRACEA